MIRYNLLYDKNTNLETLKQQLISYGATIIKELVALNVIVVDAAENTNFSSITEILSVEEDSNVTPVETFEWHQLRVASRNLPMKEHYIPQNMGGGATVYLVDSGIDTTHPEFADANIVNLHSFDGTFEPSSAHGTGVASMIVGKTLGISPNATVKSVKIPLNDLTTLSVLLEAFNAIVADKTDDIAVVNCSWHIPKSEILDNKIIEMQDLGFIVVAAAGNTVSDADNLSPVGLNSVLGVGASDAFDRVITWNEFGAGSNYGEEVDLFAPGIDVTIATLNGGTANLSGTSISAGIVSGIVAQYVTAKEDFSQQLSVETITASQLQGLIVDNSVSDVLFRDESIYYNTPNRLIMSLVRNQFFLNTIPQNIVVAPGETYTLNFEVDTNFVGSIKIDNIEMGTSTITKPEWVSLNNFDVTISPSITEETKKYRFLIEFLDFDGNRLSVYPIIVTISDDPNETLTETYQFKIDEDGVIYVTAAVCQNSGGGDSCFTDSDCVSVPPKGPFESCICDGGVCFTVE